LVETRAALWRPEFFLLMQQADSNGRALMSATDIQSQTSPRLNIEALGLAGVLGGVALLGSLPFLWTVHTFPLPPFYNEVIAAWCLACALLASGTLTGSKASIRWPLPALLLSLSALALLQYLLGMVTYSQQAIRFCLYAACMLTAYVLGRHILAAGQGRKAIDFFSAAVLIGGLYSVLVQWLQLFDLEILPGSMAVVYADPAIRTRPFGNLAQANHANTYIAIAGIAALYMAARARRSWFLVPSLLLMGSGLAITGSRMGTIFLGLIIGALFAPTALRPGRAHLRWFGSAALLVSYAIGLIAVRTAVGDVDTFTRFTQNTWPIRRELWWQASTTGNAPRRSRIGTPCERQTSGRAS